MPVLRRQSGHGGKGASIPFVLLSLVPLQRAYMNRIVLPVAFVVVWCVKIQARQLRKKKSVNVQAPKMGRDSHTRKRNGSIQTPKLVWVS